MARPAPGPPRAYRFPSFHRIRLDNGVELLVAPMLRLPVVALVVVIDAGAERDESGQEGLAQLTARSLVEGTDRWSAIEIAERLERIGASIASDADWDSATVAVSVLAERLPEAIAIVGEVLTRPAFPSGEVERLRDERLSEIVQLRSEPRGLANEMFARAAYDDVSRYALPAGGTEQSVAALDADRVQAFYGKWYAPQRTTVILSGQVTPADAEQLVGAALGKWNASAERRGHAHNTEARRGARVRIVSREEAPQSELRVGHLAVPRSHGDYFPLVVMNAILGGLFGSRINLNLREEHGYTYGAHSIIDWRRGAGPFVVRTAVESGVTADAVREILREIGRIRESQPTDDELSLARDYLVGVFPIRFETSTAIAAALAQLVIHGLPANYYDRYRDQILAVGGAEVERVARAHLAPDRLKVLAVGDAARVRGPLGQLGLGVPEEMVV